MPDICVISPVLGSNSTRRESSSSPNGKTRRAVFAPMGSHRTRRSRSTPAGRSQGAPPTSRGWRPGREGGPRVSRPAGRSGLVRRRQGRGYAPRVRKRARRDRQARRGDRRRPDGTRQPGLGRRAPGADGERLQLGGLPRPQPGPRRARIKARPRSAPTRTKPNTLQPPPGLRRRSRRPLSLPPGAAPAGAGLSVRSAVGGPFGAAAGGGEGHAQDDAPRDHHYQAPPEIDVEADVPLGLLP
jgi:hypothetical protein